VEPGAGLHYDPGSQQLLTTLRPLAAPGASAKPAGEARPVLFEAGTLAPTPLALPARRAVWLPPG